MPPGRLLPDPHGGCRLRSRPRGWKDPATFEHPQSVSSEPDITGSPTPESHFASLFDAHFADVWRFTRRRCDSSQDADDVTAETFAIACRRRDHVPPAAARPWLFGVARRVLANHRRSVDRQERVRARLAETADQAVPADGQTEPHDAIWEALAALSADDRELLVMRAWDELSVTEMASILGCSPNAVSLRLFKARRRLAHELGRKGDAAAGQVASGSLSTEGGTS
jgi:RNA polymerase sigma-70 factor, ECF subfamily